MSETKIKLLLEIELGLPIRGNPDFSSNLREHWQYDHNNPPRTYPTWTDVDYPGNFFKYFNGRIYYDYDDGYQSDYWETKENGRLYLKGGTI